RNLSFEDCRRVSAVVQYMSEVHGLSGLQPWFDVRFDTLGGKDEDPAAAYNRRVTRPKLVVELMGVSYIDQWQTAASKNLSFQSAQQKMIDVRGYDVLYQNLSLSPYDTVKTLGVEGSSWKLGYSPARLTIRLTNNRSSFVFDLNPMIAGLEEHYGKVAYATEIPPERMTLDCADGAAKASLHFSSMLVNKTGEGVRGNLLQATLMIGSGGR
ncbi:MAG TPA: hypothetical protein VFO86_01750, partial [Terriglobia bacterium]|nr:hypothetical protein [Terriglobia bacterium]